jgi:hypothetical protein
MVCALPPGRLGQSPGHVQGSLKAVAIQISSPSTPRRISASTLQLPFSGSRPPAIHDRDAYDRYQMRFMDSLRKYGGRLLGG